ncbi:MAG TPA: hypothetical protein VMY42_23035 [Thermoguttaceae bacterium]|nr:hypothetical protein [Thermoguttaceae bacterium]
MMNDERKPLQFGLRAMLMAMVAVSLLFAALRCFGVSTEAGIIVLVIVAVSVAAALALLLAIAAGTDEDS